MVVTKQDRPPVARLNVSCSPIWTSPDHRCPNFRPPKRIGTGINGICQNRQNRVVEAMALQSIPLRRLNQLAQWAVLASCPVMRPLECHLPKLDVAGLLALDCLDPLTRPAISGDKSPCDQERAAPANPSCTTPACASVLPGGDPGDKRYRYKESRSSGYQPGEEVPPEP